MHFDKRFFTYIFTAVFSLICLSGCGHSTHQKELADFSVAMTDFTQKVKAANDNINALDSTNPDSVSELLFLLDNLELEFEALSETPVPEQYKSISDLSSEAKENMANAVDYYHIAFESTTFSVDDADIAYQYYTRAMTRIQYIGYVLAGDIPEDERVTVLEETSDNVLIEKLLNKSNGEITTGEILDDLDDLFNK